MRGKNVFSEIPQEMDGELFSCLARSDNVLIERIVSRGHASPESGWYDQEMHEWVLVLEGEAIIEFKDEGQIHLKRGDTLTIPAHKMHKVIWTSKETETIWLAVHYI